MRGGAGGLRSWTLSSLVLSPLGVSEAAASVCLSFSAFARYPNGVVVHYFCCKDRTVCPTEQ